jgi:hypothetical protein
LFSNLRSHCMVGGGDESAWAALRIAGACRPAHHRADRTHSATLVKAAPERVSAPAEPQTWREGLRTLFCRSLARAISDVIFMPEGQSVYTVDGSDLQVSPQLALDILPTSWLQVGVRPATAKVDRLRAATFERLDWLHQAEAAGRQRREHQSIILDKAA